MRQNAFAAGALSRAPLGELTALVGFGGGVASVLLGEEKARRPKSLFIQGTRRRDYEDDRSEQLSLIHI